MKANSLQLLHALNAAAAVLQRTSHSEAEVFNACKVVRNCQLEDSMATS